jgi:hypothetical protein
MAEIKYNGPKNVRREVGGIVWSNENNHIAKVADPKMVKTLLAQPNGEFTLVAGESVVSEVKSKRKEK